MGKYLESVKESFKKNFNGAKEVRFEDLNAWLKQVVTLKTNGSYDSNEIQAVKELAASISIEIENGENHKYLNDRHLYYENQPNIKKDEFLAAFSESVGTKVEELQKKDAVDMRELPFVNMSIEDEKAALAADNAKELAQQKSKLDTVIKTLEKVCSDMNSHIKSLDSTLDNTFIVDFAKETEELLKYVKQISNNPKKILNTKEILSDLSHRIDIFKSIAEKKDLKLSLDPAKASLAFKADLKELSFFDKVMNVVSSVFNFIKDIPLHIKSFFNHEGLKKDIADETATFKMKMGGVYAFREVANKSRIDIIKAKYLARGEDNRDLSAKGMRNLVEGYRTSLDKLKNEERNLNFEGERSALAHKKSFVKEETPMKDEKRTKGGMAFTIE